MADPWAAFPDQPPAAAADPWAAFPDQPPAAAADPWAAFPSAPPQDTGTVAGVRDFLKANQPAVNERLMLNRRPNALNLAIGPMPPHPNLSPTDPGYFAADKPFRDWAVRASLGMVGGEGLGGLKVLPDAAALRAAPETAALAKPIPPPPAPGMTRMYHGGGDQSIGGSRWFSSDSRYAQGYADKNGGTVTYVDIPTDHPLIKPDYAEQSIDQGFHVNRELPADIADQRKPLAPAGPRGAPNTMRPAIMDENGAIHVGEPGQIHADLAENMRPNIGALAEGADKWKIGFVDENGHFMTRDSASAGLGFSQPLETTDLTHAGTLKPGTVSQEEFKPTQEALGGKPGLTEPVVETGLSKNVINAADELLRMGGVRRDPTRLISDQIFELMQTNRLNSEKISNVLNVSGTNIEDFAKLWRGSVSVWARNLQALSAVEQRLKAIRGEAGAEGAFQGLSEAAGISPEARGMSLWRRLDNTRRGLLVTQLATAVRNFETQVGRVGLDVFDQAIQGGLQKAFGSGTAPKISPLDGFDTLINLGKSGATKRQVDYVLSAFPKEQDLLFSNFSSDVARPGGPLSHVENAVNVLNTVNRTQEFIIRRAIFAARLDQQLAERGLSLSQIVKEQRVGEIRPEELTKAINDSLEMTWAKKFDLNSPAGSFINAVNKTPGASLLAPFPRYMMNSLRFQYQFSPAGYLRLLNPLERAKIASGDYSAISRATVGSALLATAYQFRNSDMAGEKWYEIKDGDRRIDMRPFAPFSSYLFVADLAKRLKDGTINQLSTTEIASGILGSTVRAGVGLYAVDQVLNDVAGLKETGKLKEFAEGLAGTTVGGLATPLATVKDFIAQFDESQRVVRDTTGSPFWGEAGRNIPYANDSLPPVIKPTQEGIVTREEPALRQLTGMTVSQPKNPAQKELDRLGFSGRDVLPSTGDPIADRMLKERMGIIVQRVIGKAVQSPGYQDMSQQAKALSLEYLLKAARQGAIDDAKKANPALFNALSAEKALSPREKKLLESLTGQPFSGRSIFKVQ